MSEWVVPASWTDPHPGERLLVPEGRLAEAEALLRRLMAAHVRYPHGWHGRDQRALATLLSDVDAHLIALDKVTP